MIAVRVAVVLSLLAGGALATGCSRGAQPQPAAQSAARTPVAQALCPVMDLTIDTGNFLDYQGRRIYLCCPDCAGKFLNAPQRYLAKLAGQAPPAQTPAGQPAQTNCPLMPDMRVNKNVYLDYEGTRVCFCCGDCLGKYKKDPLAHLQGLRL